MAYGLVLGLVAALLAVLVALRQTWPQIPHVRLWSVLVALVFLSVPLWAPLPQGAPQAVLAGLCLAWAMKVAQLQAGVVAADTRASVGRFVVWLLVPPRTAFSATPAGRWHARKQGLRRCGRAAVKAALLVALIKVDARHVLPWPFGVWAAAFEIYFVVSGLADLVTALSCFAGFATDEVFDAPFVARSPADFWGQRWNRFVSGFLRRFVFIPLARGGHVYRGAAAVFAVSGLAHEYFVYVCVAQGAYEPGYMMAFFGLQGLAVIWGAWWRAHLKPARFAPTFMKVALHLAWLAATAPLFIWPVRSELAAFEQAVLRWLA